MHIYYQGVPGAYSNLACNIARDNLKPINTQEIRGFDDFISVWETIGFNTIGVLPVENSYAGSIHENLYNFLKFDHKIIGEISLPVEHCLLSHEDKIEDIKEVYSHPQALSQTHIFCEDNGIKQHKYGDTAGAAKMLSENPKKGASAIASKLAGEIYDMNVIREGIQDQNGNTTRFFVVADKDFDEPYKAKSNKVSILFEGSHIPSVLYKCLGAFATNNINLTKIESLPSFKDPFSYIFWLDFEGSLNDENVKLAMQELEFFTKNIRILGEY